MSTEDLKKSLEALVARLLIEVERQKDNDNDCVYDLCRSNLMTIRELVDKNDLNYDKDQYIILMKRYGLM